MMEQNRPRAEQTETTPLVEILFLGLYLVIGALLIGGTYFLGGGVFAVLKPTPENIDPALLGLQRLENLVSGGNAVLGTGLYLGALILITILGFQGIYTRLEIQIEHQEKQTTYLRYLAEQARHQTRKL